LLSTIINLLRTVFIEVQTVLWERMEKLSTS